MSTFIYKVAMKRAFSVRMDETDISQLAKVADTYGMEPNAFGAMVLARFASLKPEFALDALTSIPKDFFKARPGRPATATSLAGGDKA